MLPPTTEPAEPRGLRLASVHALHGALVACRDVSFSVGQGELVALIGPNGAGKTSLVGAISGLVGSKGMITLDGVRLDGRPAHLRTRAGLATVPDNRGLFTPLTVEDNIQLAAQLIPKSKRAAAMESALSHFPILRKRWNAPAGALSGGEQQMLSIAKSLTGLPKALVLDEPSQGLAPIILDELVSVFAELKRTGLPILLVEQNHGLVERVADRFVALVGGDVCLEGTASDLLDRDRLARLFLGTKDSSERITAKQRI